MEKRKTYEISKIKTDELTQTVIEITELGLGFEGNIIPNSWFTNITNTDKTKTHLLATVILSELCYWYRATEIRDQGTGKTIGWKKKFEYHKLVKSYKDLAKKFGQSKIAVKRAVDILVNSGLITREIACLSKESGEIIFNTVFLEPVPEKVKEITYDTFSRPALQKSKAGLTFLLSKPYEKVNYSKSYNKELQQRVITPALQTKKHLLKEENLKKAVVPLSPNFRLNGKQFDIRKILGDSNHEKALIENPWLNFVQLPDKKIFKLLKDVFLDEQKNESVLYVINELRLLPKIPKNFDEKLEKLENILERTEKAVLEKSIRICRQKKITDKLSYLWGVIKKNQGIKA